MSFWRKIRYRIEWLAVRALAFAVPLMSRRFAYGVAKGLGNVAFRLDKRGRQTALENLRAVYGDRYSRSEREAIAREAFQNFAHTVLDQFWSPRLNRENYLEYCEIQFEDNAAIEAVRETGAIWVTPHYSNFEWIALMMGFRGYEFTIIAQDFKNPLLTGIFQKNREVSGHQVIPQRGALLRLLKNLKNRGHAAFLTDLNIPPGRAATLIESMGFQTCVTTLHAELLRRTRLPVIPGICLPKPDGNYIMRGFPPIRIEEGMTDREIAQLCWDAFEPFILENPAPWLWMYKHWRYLPEGGEGRYPAYAHRSKKFDRFRKQLAGESANA